MQTNLTTFARRASLSICLVVSGGGPTAADTQRSGDRPTFAKQVAPILFEHCVVCHRSDGVAASSPLVTYDDTKRSAVKIKERVQNRSMPPWPADSTHSLKLRNDPRLTQQDIDTLSAWVDDGMRQGSDADLPAVPTFPKGWLHPQGLAPDVVVSLPAYTVKATGEVPYIQFRIKVPLARDRWVSALQVRPSNIALVHHLAVAEVDPGDGMTRENMQTLALAARQMGLAEGAFATDTPVVVDPENPGAYDMLGIYTPGTTFESYGPGNAKLLRGGPNNYLNFNVHYTTTGRTETDRTELALWFQPQLPKHQLLRVPASGKTIIANGRQLLTDDPGTKAEGAEFAIPPIPPNAGSYSLIGMTAYSRPVTLYQFQPHAHLRAKDFTYIIVYPDGREKIVLSVPKYDFHWQLAYDLATPLELPAGSKLVVSAHYDNSAKNAELVAMSARDTTGNCGPDKVAYFRRLNQSWDEMFTPMIQYSIDDESPANGGHAGGSLRSPQRAGSAPIVQAVGCLAQMASGRWVLNRSSPASATATQSASRQVLDAIASQPLGTREYGLIGVSPFDPSRHAGQTVAVKGALIGGELNGRLNVTSLETIRGLCE